MRRLSAWRAEDSPRGVRVYDSLTSLAKQISHNAYLMSMVSWAIVEDNALRRMCHVGKPIWSAGCDMSCCIPYSLPSGLLKRLQMPYHGLHRIFSSMMVMFNFIISPLTRFHDDSPQFFADAAWHSTLYGVGKFSLCGRADPNSATRFITPPRRSCGFRSLTGNRTMINPT